jgi:MoxR-like ATPase
VVRLLWRTREDPRVELGASPRAGLLLLRAAKAQAMMLGRDHALPDDVQALAEPVLSHRLVLAPEVPRGAGKEVVADAISSVRAL